MFPGTPMFEAKVSAVPSEEGGRLAPMFSGYRPSFWLGELTSDGLRCYQDATIILLDVERLAPGEAAAATLCPIGDKTRWRAQELGTAIGFYEGWRHVGTATLTKRLEIEGGADST
jgi:hypothetical protein